MKVINVHEAKTHFSKLLDRAARGESIILGKAGKPVAKLEPYPTSKVRRGKYTGGTLRLQAHSKHKLTPEYLNKLADSKYDD